MRYYKDELLLVQNIVYAVDGANYKAGKRFEN
jgi:hypothetical protein